MSIMWAAWLGLAAMVAWETGVEAFRRRRHYRETRFDPRWGRGMRALRRQHQTRLRAAERGGHTHGNA